MKKLIYFMSIMFLVLGFKVVSIKAVSPEVIYQENIYSNRIGDKLYSGQMGFEFMDGHIAYCLEPFEIVGKTYYENSEYLSRFDESTIEYFELVAYYGYNSERNSIYYYMAAQEIIWEKIMGGDYVYWTTGIDGTGDIINIDSYKNEILDNVNRFYLRPSFEENLYSFPFFDEMVIYDSNNVFKDYNSYQYEGNNQVIKNDKGFKIIILEEGKQVINYSKTLKTDNSTIVYTGTGNQTLASFGINKTISGKVYIFGQPYSTRINLIFYDNKTKEKIDNVDFNIEGEKKLTGNWINDEGTYYYDTPVKEGTYQIEVSDYIIVGDNYFIIKKEDLTKYTTIEVYLDKEIEEPIEEIKPDEEEIPEIPKEEKEPDNIEPEIPEKKEPDNIELEIPEKKEEQPKIEEENPIVPDDKDITPDVSEEEIIISSEELKQNEILYLDKENSTDNQEINEETLLIDNKIFEELPNTSNYNLIIYTVLILNLFIGIIIYEKNRN